MNLKVSNLKLNKTMKKITLILAGMLACVFNTQANNVTLTNPSVAGQNLSFKISWENSWNTNYAPNNWDAVWVFVKIQDCATQLWSHANLSTVVGDHTAAAPLMIETVTDGKGVFIRRSAVGGGNISATNITLKLNVPAGTYNYKVYGIEMVNVPTGTFTAGGAGSEGGQYNATLIDAAAQSSGLTAATIGGSSVGIPNTFPMGYNSFYCMKYEITQQQYVDFLNSLTYTQQANRVDVAPNAPANTYALTSNGSGNNRNTIVIQTPGNNSALPAVFACGASTVTGYSNGDDGESIACNKLSSADVWSYLDWAALRPMTELEYEKVCRGPMSIVANEYAWGSTDITYYYNANGYLTNALMPTEKFTSTVSNGSCLYGVNSGSGSYGPCRVGVFATNSSGRSSAGASYYGAMEMSGNVWETTITTGNSNGVGFNGTKGDGALDANGNYDTATWPVYSGTNGITLRGGCWVNTSGYAVMANRSYPNYNQSTRAYTYGGRGVR